MSEGETIAKIAGTPPSPARDSGRSPGRPKGRRSDVTRTRILDAAERLFANRGYEGASIRDVAAAADVQVHAVSYHFGPKEALFDAVVVRRAAIMTAHRRAALEAARTAAADGPIPIAAMVRAYVTPFIRSAGHGQPGWRNYAALMGRLANSPLGTEIIAKHYDETARAYIAEFGRALPEVDAAELVDGFLDMVAAMLAICARTGRSERLSGRRMPRSTEESIETLVRFHTAGFLALAAKPKG